MDGKNVNHTNRPEDPQRVLEEQLREVARRNGITIDQLVVEVYNRAHEPDDAERATEC